MIPGSRETLHLSELRRRKCELLQMCLGKLRVESDEVPRIPIRQRLQEHRVHDAENRRSRADAKTEAQHRGRREPGRLSERTQSVANILHQHKVMLPWRRNG